jgi:glycine/D-amino acid oxidase-like deaminating enzyme
MTATRQHVIVVGAGIIGASVAWHLAKAGSKVTMIAEQSGGVATLHSFAWINASWGNAPSYAQLRMRAIEHWHRLCAEVPGLAVTFNGSISWDLPPEKLEIYIREHTALGYNLQRLDRNGILQREPNLAEPPEFAVLAPKEGAAEPDETTRLLIAKAQDLGAQVIGAAVTGLVSRGGAVTGIVTSSEIINADHVVVAAGIGSKDLASSIGVSLPLEAPAGLLIRTRPQRPLLNGLVLSPDLHMRQDNQGRIIAGGDYGGSEPGLDEHETAQALFSKVKSMFTNSNDMALESYGVGYRPMPADGLPIIGPVGSISRVSFAVMHSGVTLAALIGQALASEVTSETPSQELEPYRLGRFNAQT